MGELREPVDADDDAEGGEDGEEAKDIGCRYSFYGGRLVGRVRCAGEGQTD